MIGETDLDKLLSSMSPSLMHDEYVFLSFHNAVYGDYADLQPIMTCQESEGMTMVIRKKIADQRQITYEGRFKGITLKVHSSLQAIGLTAAFSNKLTEHGISANVVAGYFHDHIFVQSEYADLAMTALNELAGK